MIDHGDGVLQEYDLADGRGQQIRWDPSGDKARDGAKKNLWRSGTTRGTSEILIFVFG